MVSSLKLGRVLSVPVEVNISWIFVFVLLTYLLSGEFEDHRLHWSMTQRWSVAMITVVLSFLSVLVHELSHSFMALNKGIPVRGITLFIFGGVSRLGREPQRPITEFMIALAGPLVSILLAAILGVVWVLLGRGDSSVEVILILLAWINLSLCVFNLIPGYPLDGGRLLRASIWGLTGNHRIASLIASVMGLIVGGCMVLGGAALVLILGPIYGVWFAVVGAFLFLMAGNSHQK